MTTSDFELVLIEDISLVKLLISFELTSLLFRLSANEFGCPLASGVMYVCSETSGMVVYVLFELDVVVVVAFELELLYRKLAFELLAKFDIIC